MHCSFLHIPVVSPLWPPPRQVQHSLLLPPLLSASHGGGTRLSLRPPVLSAHPLSGDDPVDSLDLRCHLFANIWGVKTAGYSTAKRTHPFIANRILILLRLAVSSNFNPLLSLSCRWACASGKRLLPLVPFFSSAPPVWDTGKTAGAHESISEQEAS